MKTFIRTCVFTFFTLTCLITFAQENTAALCSNGIDDDGDGLIDCFDNECSTATSFSTCDDFFFGNSVVCFEEVDVESFAMRQQWGSADQTATSHASPAIGDLDQNGIPEVVAVNNFGSTITILNGATGATIASRAVGFNPENTPALANIFNDETTEILVTENEGRGMVLFSEDLSTEIWREDASQNDMGIAGFADFNEDGVAEIYYKNEIVNATNGVRLIAGNGDWERDYVHGPIAIDILPATDPDCIAAGGDCNGLELITGNHVWAVDIANGTHVIVKNMNDVLAAQGETRDYFPKYWGGWLDGTRSTVSAADYNLDGNVDILLSGALGDEGTDQTTIFFWDVMNGTVVTYHDPANDFERGPGRINIGDVDGDGQPNANFVMDQRLYSLDENFGVHWVIAIKEGSSGFTGCTLFDFDGDGTVETVYRSEESVLIIDGTDGSTLREIVCVSRTQEEYPVVADVDGDGASEICVACYTNNSTSFSPYSNTQFSQIRVYESDGEAWMPARDVWNQHGYFNVNINDDLTVPIELQDHTRQFSDGVCNFADGSAIPFPSRPLNTFLTQAPILDENGCVEFVSPDMVIAGNPISASPAICPDAEIEVTFTLTNEGDTDISGGLPVSYYAGDPLTGAATYLDTETEILLNFQVGASIEITQNINGIGGEFTLFVVVNDLGGTPPIAPSADELPNATIPECETANNISSVPITFQPFALTVNKLNDDRRCDLNLTANGSATAFYNGPSPGVQEFIYLENFDDLSNGTTSDVGTTGWTSDPGTLTPDFYGIADYNGTKMFEATNTGVQNGEGEVTWTSQAIDISDHTDISVTLDLFENGNMENYSQVPWFDYAIVNFEVRDNGNNVISSGQFPNFGNVDGDFTYTQSSLTGIRPDDTDPDSLLIISVTIHNTASSEHHYIDNVLVQGQQEDIVKNHTEADGFEFRWYNRGDYSTVLHTGSTFNQMAFGDYDVIASFPGTSCTSDTVPLTINNLNSTSTPPYLVHAWIYEVSPLDNCDMPNGALRAFAYSQTQNGTFPASVSNIPLDTLGVADGYTFTWRLTSDATNTPIGTGDLLQNLTNQGYTVDVVEAFSGCSTSQDATVSSGLSFPPAPNVTVVNITTCGGTGTLSADVGGNTSNYTFEWYDGPGVKPVPDFTGVTYTVNDIGDYTVVATQTSSSCPSDPATATMGDDSSAPVATLSLVQNNTFCEGGNGIIEADGDGAGTVIGFDFDWYKGANTLPANALPGSAEPNSFLVSDNPFQLGGLTEGTYRVVVTENATSCSDTLDIFVQDTPGSLMVTPNDLIVNDINSCNASILGSIDASMVVPGDVNTITIGNINSDFEDPDISEPPINRSTFTFLNQTDLPGWSTTASDGVVELWNDGFGGVPAYSGEQFAEILANQIGALYFDLSTTPGALFSWSFAHRGRSGVDNIRVSIGAIGAELQQGDFSTGTTDWRVYSGTYTVPDGQLTTRFQFESLDPGSVGNFVDSVTFVLFPYRFELYQGTTASGTPDSINTTGQFDMLDNGDYVLVVYDNLTGCNATEIPFTLDRNTEEPDIATALTPDVSCTGGSGEISVTPSMPTTSEPATYTYELYNGHSFASLNSTITGATGNQLFTALNHGDYRVNIINDETQCDAFVDVNITNAENPPVVISTAFTDNSACGGGNGAVSVTVDADGNGTPEASNLFQFTWYDGPDTSSPVLASDVAGLDILNQTTGFNLDAGDYTVVVETIATGCESAQRTITINDDPYIPNIVISEVAPQTDCATGNGSLRAVIDNDPDCPGGGSCASVEPTFTFRWFATGTTTPVLGTNSTITGLTGGTYDVEVTHSVTGCVNTASFTLSVDQIIPVVTFDSRTTNSVCDNTSTPFTGSITVTSTYNGANFTSDADADYDWYEGSDLSGTLIAGENGNTLSNIQEGFYTVVVNNSTTSCPSTPITVEVLPALDNPIIAFNSMTPNTVCDPALADDSGNDYTGALSVTVTGGSGSFSYQWYSGSSVSVAGELAGETNATLSTADGGTYTVEVTDNVNGCVSTFTDDIDDGTGVPSLDLADVVPTDVSVCSGAPNFPNGSITVNEVDSQTDFTDYSFEWFTGSGTGSPIAGQTANTISNLAIGEYTVRVTNDVTGCVSVTRTVEIEETLVAIQSAETINNLTDCSSPNGSIGVTASMADANEPSGYTFEWFFGTGTGNTLDGGDLVDNTNFATSTTGTNQATASGLEPGTYTVRITNNDTQCDELFEYDILNTPLTPTIATAALAAGVTDNTICTPGSENGIIDVSTTVTPTIASGVVYEFDLFDDTPALVTTINSGVTTQFTGVTAGDYTVVARIVGSPGDGCESAAAAVRVEDNFTLPNVSLTKLSDETNCNASNGQIRINSTDTPPASGYTVTVYQGVGVSGTVQENLGTVSAFPVSTTANLDDRTYTVEVTNNETGCSSTAQLAINEDFDEPAVDAADVTRTNVTSCLTNNGSITVTVDNSNIVNNAGSDPVFNLYSGSSITGTPVQSPQPGSNTHTFSGLAAGTYTISIQKDESGCESNGITRTIGTTPITFTPGITTVNDQTSCDLNDPNGQLTGSITAIGTGPSTDVADYNFEWFLGSTTNASQEVTLQVATAVISGATNHQVSGLSAGTYTVLVTDPVSGCSYSTQTTIITDQVDPVIDGAIAVTPSNQCSPGNGSLTITVNDGGSDDPSNGAGGYTFELFEGTSLVSAPLQTINQTTVAGLTDQASVTFNGLSEGDYTIRATDNNTSCLVVSALQSVGYSGPNPNIDPNNMNNNPLSTGCFDSDGTLDIGNALTNIPATYTDPITITWFIGTDTSDLTSLISAQVPGAVFDNTTTLNNGGNPVTVVNGEVDNLPAVSYTGVLSFTNGCKFLINTSLSLVDQPDVATSVSTSNTRCSTPYDGEITIDIDPADGISADNYNYVVYAGDLTILPNQTPGPPFDPPLTDPSYGTPVASGTFADNGTGIGAANATSVIITNLNSGRYTIGINVNDGDECITNVLSETIADPEEPSVTLNTSSDNGICDVSGALTFNGSITVDASHPSLANAADFTWYEDLDDNGTYVALQAGNGSGSGFNVANETEAGVTTNTVSGLGAGKYRVVIENNATACTDTLDVELFDDPVELTAQIGVDAAAPTNIVNCGGVGSFTLNQVRENGVANVNVAADFTTTWTRNGAAFTPDSEDADADLPVGNYELTIVRDNTGCRTTLGFSIDDDTENPIIDLVNETDNSICDGGPLTPNGAIQIQVVDNLNNVLTAGDYTYAWFFGSGTGNTLDAGDLTDGAGLAGLGTNTISGLEAGIYTVVVTDNAGTSLACFAQAEFEVENAQLPVAIQQDLGTDYTIQHQINCTPNENGTITLLNVYENGTAVAVNANYTFTWYDDNVGTPLSVGTISGASNQTVSDLPSGNYFVEVTNVNTDCVSPLVSFEIEDDRDFPNVQISFTAQDTECETATGNGSVVAQVVATGGGFETVTDYTWIWFEGTGTGTALGTSVSGFTATNNVVTDLPSGTYTVQVQDNTSTCSRTETIVLPQFTPVISISDAQVSLTAQTNCAGNENGTATVNELQFTNPDGSVTNVTLPDADWQIDWHTTVSGGAAFITDNEAATGLTGGTTYFIQATNTATSCLINPRKAVTIPTDISPVELTINQNSPDQFCSPMTAGNGQLAVAIEIDGVLQDPTQYTVEWFVGSGTGTPIGTSALTGFSLQNNDTTLTNIPNGTYTVRATKNGTAPTAPGIGCANTAEGSITISEEEIVLISGDFTTSPNTICNPAAAAGGISNGSITIVDVTEGGVSTGGTAGFTFAWTGENGVVITTQAPNASGNTGTSISGLVKGTYEVTITNTSRGCDSEVIQIEVSENFTLPSLAVTGTNDNTHCAGAPTFTGSIAVQASGGTGPYSFVWHDGSNPSGGTTGTIASTSPNSTASNLDGDSFYTVVVTDDATGCTVTETYFVDNVITIPVLELSGIETLPDTTCAGHPNDPSGAIIIDDNDITGVLTDYTITLERGAVGSGIVLAGAFVAGTPATLTYTSLEPADYFFTATNPTTGCSIAPVRVNVEDSTRNPQIGLVTITPDQNCGGATNYGGIEIVIDDSFDHTAARFDVQWHDGFGAASAIAGANTVSISGVAAGNYSVEVTNNLTGCSQTEDFIIPNQIVRPSITMSQVGNNTTCDDDGNNLPVDVGSYEVTQTTYDGSSIDPRTVPADYSLAIFPDASLTPGSEIVDNDGATPFLYEELSTGDYYAVITHIPSGCTSNSSRFDIIDVLTRPAVAITLLQADSTCSSATANGSLFGRVFIDGINDIDDTHPSFGNYTFQWYTGSGAVPGNEIAAGSGGNSSTVSNLVTGTYTLEVTLDSTGCTTEEEFILPNAPTYVEIINATPTPSTNCIGNGSAVITTMNRTDPLFTPSNFTFDYFDTDPTVGSPTPIIDDGNESALSGVMAGTYYVIGTHATLLCTTPVFEIEILQSVDPPVVFLDDFRFQTNCNPAIPDGRLTINVDGTPTPSVTDYTIQWYRNSVDPANIITGEDSATIDSIAAGIYVARVTSNLTGCFTDYNEVMDDDILDPYGVQISTQGNISCVAPFDGSANARVIIPIRKDQSQHHERNVSDYGYLWYLGDVSSPNPTAYNEANALIDSLEEGVYTVLVIDSVDNSCVYEPIRVEVEDLTSPPRYSTFEVNPVTVCYEDDRVNGSVVLAVDTADTKNENVIVEWFDDSGNLISNNPTILSPLDVGTYSLRLTNPTTGCVTNETFFIDRVVNPPVAPTVIANGNRTSCSTANGSAIANVNGITTGYEFEWFNTNDLTTPYTTGSSVTNLDSATYLVRATDIATGCQSPFTSVTFDYVITDIEFEMDISVATCSRTVDGAVNQFNTLVRVEIDNETNPILPGLDEREATNFEWRNANGDIIENESDQLLDVAPGNYTVTFTARNGCTYTSAFNVSTDIEVYNGLSPNDDGLNDFLLIDCIDYFAGNKVQIFNRDGIKVYEINGYDNVNNRFEGFSNVGGGGLSLPTGTYFAVVELNDGKDPVQFYLELVR